jgi:DNA-binding transcriptional LysR family regulator
MSGLPFTLRQLEIFSSLCATSSFRRSAERLGISQASVSNQVKTLEEQLGITLFARRPGQRPVLTPEGVAFAEDLRDFEAAGRRLASHRRSGRDLAKPVRYKVLIGQGLADNFVKPKLDRFFAANPLIEFDFESRPPSARLAYDIEESQFDFALVHRRADRSVDSIMRELALVRGGVYGHRSFAEGKTLPLSPEELSALPFIMSNAQSSSEREILLTLERNGIRPRQIVGHTQYYDVMAAMLERGLGVASFSDAIMNPALREHVIMLFPLNDWRLLWFRRDRGEDPRCDIVESFFFSAVLQDPDYPTISAAGERKGKGRLNSA